MKKLINSTTKQENGMDSNSIDTNYEMIVQELDLVRLLLKLLTEYDLLKMTRKGFCLKASFLLSQYIEMKGYDFYILDDLNTFIFNLTRSKDQQVDFTYLKSYLMNFINDHKFAIGQLVVTGCFKAFDYNRVEKNFGNNMLAFLRDFVDDSQFNVWYLDPHAPLIHEKHSRGPVHE